MPAVETRMTCSQSLLTAVPSVHYSLPFAQEVHRICSTPEYAPNAIAVELGPVMAQTAREWISELSGSPERRKPLPVMLGLVAQNRWIRPALKDKATKLQAETGRELHEVPPAVLRDELGFYGAHTLQLSPTDSIIEAIRCSVELGVPLYGVDLEEMADRTSEQVLLPDPWRTPNDIHGYVDEHGGMASGHGDPEIDTRREAAMAARLKTVLGRHRRVLFVGGLGHWSRLQLLLHDRDIAPAPLQSPRASEVYPRRVVVHPSLALVGIDLWPALIQLWEDKRHGGRSGPPSVRLAEVKGLLRRQLKRVNQNYFYDRPDGGIGWTLPRDLASLPRFESFMGKLCLLHGRRYPDLPLLLKSARAVMSEPFVQALTDVFMDFPWADPEQLGCPVLQPDNDARGEPLCGLEYGDRRVGRWKFYLKSRLSQLGPERDLVVRPRSLKKLADPFSLFATGHTWGPWDYLVSGLSLRAIQKVLPSRAETSSEKFSGGSMARVDVKETIKALVRGKDDIYIHRDAAGKEQASVGLREMEPVVWILDGQSDSPAEWATFGLSLSGIEKYATDKARFAEVRHRRAERMVCAAVYRARSPSKTRLVKDRRIDLEEIRGLVLFDPICWKLRQFAAWLEATDFRRNPFADSADSLLRQARIDGGAGKAESDDDWRTTLAMTALPYSRQRLVIVAPDDFVPTRRLVSAAAQRGVKVSHVPHSTFDAVHIERLKWCHMTPLDQVEPNYLYPRWVEEAIGESQDLYRDAVPAEWLHFGDGGMAQ